MIDVTPLIGSHDPVGDEERLPVEDPATGERIGSVPVGDPRDVDRAVALATEAASAWSGASVHERAAVLHALAALPPATAKGFLLENSVTMKELIQPKRRFDEAALLRRIDELRASRRRRLRRAVALHGSGGARG